MNILEKYCRRVLREVCKVPAREENMIDNFFYCKRRKFQWEIACEESKCNIYELLTKKCIRNCTMVNKNTKETIVQLSINAERKESN